MPIISVKHLSKTYTSWKKEPGLLGSVKSIFHRESLSIPAVQDISFSINEREFVGFIGPNGAGKTTTLKMLSGILWPTNGTARVLGFEPWKREREFQRQFALVLGQKNQLWWDLPARETFLLNKEIYGLSSSAFERRLKEFGELLDTERLFDIPVRKLSLGERMKCELINALLHEPRVLFLDEPTIGLDVISQKAIRDFLKDWNKHQGTTVILTSHAMADVQALCERVLVIDHGSLAYDGSLEQLIAAEGDEKEITVTFEKPIRKKDLEDLAPIVSFSPLKTRLRVARTDVRDIAKKLLDSFPIADLSIEELAIEDVVRKIFKR